MGSGWITLLIVSIAVIALTGIIVTGQEESRLTRIRTETCHPYSVLGRYRVSDRFYVVCGNEEHREYTTAE